MRASASLVVLFATALLLSACAGSSTDELVGSTDLAEAVAAPPTPENEAASPAPFPTVVVATSTGGQIDFGSLAGQDTVLWFWAPW